MGTTGGRDNGHDQVAGNRPGADRENGAARKRIAIACQGGGAQCAFVAGALKTLLAEGVQHRFKIVGLSGTSGGAFTAALGWLGLLQEAHGDRTPADRIMACWNDLTAQTPIEIAVDGFCTQLMRLVDRGWLPSVASSPASEQSKLWSQVVASMIGRPEFTDLKALLCKHLNFDALPSLIEKDSPVLLVGAADVLKGSYKVFTSWRGEISVDALLASAAIPMLFPTVQVNGHSYWDGLFSANPPIMPFLREPYMGKKISPQEIWIIQVNPVERDSVPQTPHDISDRRNHLAGNLTLQHELHVIDLVNMLLEQRALSDEFRTRMGVDAVDPITVRFIRMSKALADSLDYPSKLSRQPGHIAKLVADGEAQTRLFLQHDADRPLKPAELRYRSEDEA